MKLAEIFDLFDLNGNGRISADEIDLDRVSAELLILFKPLLVEMENFSEDLDKDEFVESALALLEKSTITAKSQILNYGRKVPRSHTIFDKDLVFHPKIDANSRAIMQSKSRYDVLQKVAPEVRLNLKKEAYDRHRDVLAKEQVDRELEPCTFAPNFAKKL